MWVSLRVFVAVNLLNGVLGVINVVRKETEAALLPVHGDIRPGVARKETTPTGPTEARVEVQINAVGDVKVKRAMADQQNHGSNAVVAIQPPVEVHKDVIGNNVVYDTSANRFLVALGVVGYASCPNGTTIQCDVMDVPAGLGSVDDLVAADGLIFMLNTRTPMLAVVRGDGSLAQTPITVPGLPFTGISAAGGNAIVSGGTSTTQAFTYDATGILTPAQSANQDLGKPDVYQPSGDIAFVSSDFSPPINGNRFGVAVYNVPSLQVLNRIGTLSGGIPPYAMPFETHSANFPVVTTSYQAAGTLCMLAVSPDGFSVICNPADPQQSTRFDAVGTSGALGVAVGGNTGFVILWREGILMLNAYDLSPLPNGAPSQMGSRQLATGISHPVAVAASPDGGQVVVAANSAGLLVTSGNFAGQPGPVTTPPGAAAAGGSAAISAAAATGSAAVPVEVADQQPQKSKGYQASLSIWKSAVVSGLCYFLFRAQ